MAKLDREASSRALIEFVQTFTNLLEQHLHSAREEMAATVNEVMESITELSRKTEQKKREANETLVTTYTNPDEESKQVIDAIQSSVDDVFTKAQANEVSSGENRRIINSQGGGASDLSASQIIEDQVRRHGGIFSKHMEALSTLDGELQDLIFKMVGALSQDDVIAQRVEHVEQNLHALQASLSYLLVDFEGRCTSANINQFFEDIQSYALKSYTMNSERELHFKMFPQSRKKAG